jgi:hypothetical protein
MTVTFQAQIDPYPDEKSWSQEELLEMWQHFRKFEEYLGTMNYFVRSQMYTDNKDWRP